MIEKNMNEKIKDRDKNKNKLEEKIVISNFQDQMILLPTRSV